MAATRVNSKKPHEVYETIFEGDEYSFEGPIEKVISQLQEIKDEAEAKGFYNISYGVEKERGYSGEIDEVVVEITGDRLETDKEIKARLTKWRNRKQVEKKFKEQKENNERALYKRLKEKFKDER